MKPTFKAVRDVWRVQRIFQHSFFPTLTLYFADNLYEQTRDAYAFHAITRTGGRRKRSWSYPPPPTRTPKFATKRPHINNSFRLRDSFLGISSGVFDWCFVERTTIYMLELKYPEIAAEMHSDIRN